jgi:hypothetical protein
MDLHLQLDSFAPEKFTSLLLCISRMVPILVPLVMLVVLLMWLLVKMRLLLVAHEETFSFLCLLLQVASSMKEGRISPSRNCQVLVPPFCCAHVCAMSNITTLLPVGPCDWRRVIFQEGDPASHSRGWTPSLILFPSRRAVRQSSHPATKNGRGGIASGSAGKGGPYGLVPVHAKFSTSRI